MSSGGRMLRLLARVILSRSLRIPIRSQSSWAAFLEAQLDHIGSDVEALVWAVGCFWTLRVERLIVRWPPPANCFLFLVGLFLGLNFLLPHLSWYGLPCQRAGEAASARGFARIAILIGSLALVGLATPGSPRRRIFAACTFPWLGLLGLGAAATATAFANSIMLPAGYVAIESALRGVAFGLAFAAALSLPATLLYRATAAPIAGFALMPAVAKASFTAGPYAGPAFFWHFWPFLCALALMSQFTRALHCWQSRPLTWVKAKRQR